MVTIHAHSLESSPIPYCQAAINADIESGYRVRILPQRNEAKNALGVIAFLVLVLAVLWLAK